MKKIWIALLCAMLLLTGCMGEKLPEELPNELAVEPSEESVFEQEESASYPDESGYYYGVEDVVLFLDVYDRLPDNFITKKEAEALGWDGGSVEPYMEGGAIGGDRFGNREELLPEESGRTYTECDIDTLGKDSRGPKRLVFSSDGLYFYTENHYESFEELTVTEDGEVEWK